MKNIILLAETGSDIPEEVARQYGIYLVPMHVSFEREMKDDGSFPSEEIVSYYKRFGKLPKTSGCVPEDFIKIFDRIHEENPDSQILHLAYSAVTTCSYQSAQIAAENRDYVASIDTKQVSAGQYAVVITMARLLKEHPEWDIEAALAKAEEISESVSMCFVPDTLEFLRAGGRVSNAAALCGALLKLHPRIEILDGYLQATKKHRGSMKKVIPQLVKEYIEEKNMMSDELWLIRTPGFDEEIIRQAQETASMCGVKKVTWVKTGGVITTHGGPGAFGIAGFTENKN